MIFKNKKSKKRIGIVPKHTLSLNLNTNINLYPIREYTDLKFLICSRFNKEYFFENIYYRLTSKQIKQIINISVSFTKRKQLYLILEFKSLNLLVVTKTVESNNLPYEDLVYSDQQIPNLKKRIKYDLNIRNYFFT